MSVYANAGAVSVVACDVAAADTAKVFGFSTKTVVDATAEVIGDLLPYDAQHAKVWLAGAPDWFYWHQRDEHVVRRLRLSGGTLEYEAKYPKGWEWKHSDWRDTQRSKNAQRDADLWHDDTPPACSVDGCDAVGVHDLQLSDGTCEWVCDAHLLRRGVIRKWSAKSRRRMIRALARLHHEDWEHPEWRLSMVTLTLPDDWRAVAPRGKDFKDMVRRLQLRWKRAGLGKWQAVWKLEFQERGAPHMHLMMRVPDEGWRDPRGRMTFRMWLSKAWADCVRADRLFCHRCGIERCDCPMPDTEYSRNVAAGTNVDFGFRGTDPQRITAYFLKHSSKTSDNKEYQHHVPIEWWSDDAGPGRFWGITGLEQYSVAVELDARAAVRLVRILRGLVRAKNAEAALARRRHAVKQVGESTRRSTLEDLRAFGRRRVRSFSDSLRGGFVVLHDAPLTAYRIAHFLSAGPPGYVQV